VAISSAFDGGSRSPVRIHADYRTLLCCEGLVCPCEFEMYPMSRSQRMTAKWAATVASAKCDECPQLARSESRSRDCNQRFRNVVGGRKEP